ncbi:MAG: hypothetical protein ABL893_10680 [Hyphomicrobium sp.]|nr:hypothetical protein [Hyphomicrobium sp.]
MSTRTNISLLLSVMVSSVLFGIGAATVLSIKSLSAQASTLLPLVIVMSFALAGPISWYLAPRLRAKYLREESIRERYQ